MINSRSNPARGSTSRFDDLADAIALYARLRSGRSELAGLARRVDGPPRPSHDEPGTHAWACEVADESSFRALGPVVCDALGRPHRPGFAGDDIAVDPGTAALVGRAVRTLHDTLGCVAERQPLTDGLADPGLIRAVAAVRPGGFELRLGFSLASTGVGPTVLGDASKGLARTHAELDARFRVGRGRGEWVLGVSCPELVAPAVRIGGTGSGVFVAYGGPEIAGLAGRAGPPVARLSRVLIGEGVRDRADALRSVLPGPRPGNS